MMFFLRTWLSMLGKTLGVLLLLAIVVVARPTTLTGVVGMILTTVVIVTMSLAWQKTRGRSAPARPRA